MIVLATAIADSCNDCVSPFNFLGFPCTFTCYFLPYAHYLGSGCSFLDCLLLIWSSLVARAALPLARRSEDVGGRKESQAVCPGGAGAWE